MKIARLLLVALSLLITTSLFAEPQINRSQNNTEIILQGFHWNSYSYSEGGKPHGWYRFLTKKVNEFSSLGITAIWLPPPSASFEGDASQNWPHSRGYLPTEYYKLDTYYGTEAELRTLIKELQKRGIKSIADIVINHRHAVGWSNNPDGSRCQNIFYNPNWGPETIVKNDSSKCGRSGNLDTGAENVTFLDLDHLNPTVQHDLTDWLKWLRFDVGFAGWRYDQAKGYGGRFVGMYNKETDPEISIGEFWDNDRQLIVNWMDETWKPVGLNPNDASGAFDFPNRTALRAAVNNSEYWWLRGTGEKPIGVVGLWPEKAYTFVENHDTRTTEPTNRFSDDPSKMILGYAYILTHPGIPTIFIQDLFDDQLFNSIQKLMKLRTHNNIQPTSKVEIRRAEFGLYAAIIDDKVAIKMGSTEWMPEAGSGSWKLVLGGQDYAIWEK